VLSTPFVGGLVSRHCSTSVSGIYRGVNGRDEEDSMGGERDCDSFEGRSDEEGMGEEHYV
jgi:hypothetical protein